MSDIKFFLKFGERKYLEQLQAGKLFFSNACKYRLLEEQLVKGQGDKLEAGSYINALSATAVDNNTGASFSLGHPNTILVYFEPAEQLPVFCLFCCFEKDCVIDENNTISIRLSGEIKGEILKHFPNADTVAVIKEPYQFIQDVRSSIGYECKSDLVNYFHLTGFNSDNGLVNDFSYYKYLTQDTPSVDLGGKRAYSFDAKYVYRALLCKDVFFKNEQEYRFILPELNIPEGRVFPVNLNTAIELYDIDEFFSY